MGEPAGIGGEILLKAWMDRASATPPFVAIDDEERLASIARGLGVDAPIEPVESAEDAISVFASALPVLPQSLRIPAKPGAPDVRNAPAVIASIERAVGLTLDGEASAVVTNPIQKKPLYDAGFPHPGHTEFLGALCGIQGAPVMMLAVPGLRVVPVTVHMALSHAVAALTVDAIVHAGRAADEALRQDFGIARPRIAVAGLNPHAGEDATLGDEEQRLIAPAIQRLRDAGADATGPHPADTLFHAAARARFDVALCMYHDQALIPLKTVDFDHGVNVTLGLPIVRTSPDHGTALDIAGTGKANAASLIAALRLAGEMAAHRSAHAAG